MIERYIDLKKNSCLKYSNSTFKSSNNQSLTVIFAHDNKKEKINRSQNQDKKKTDPCSNEILEYNDPINSASQIFYSM